METRSLGAPCPVCGCAVKGWASVCPRCGYHPDRYNRALDDVALIFRLSSAAGDGGTAPATANVPSRVRSLLRRIVGLTGHEPDDRPETTNPPPEGAPGAGSLHEHSDFRPSA
jgi:hypothetical protein